MRWTRNRSSQDWADISGDLSYFNAAEGSKQVINGTVGTLLAKNSCQVVSGQVTGVVFASNNALVYSKGETTQVVSTLRATSIHGGDPQTVVAEQRGSSIVFGSPPRVAASDRGEVTIVTDDPDYAPNYLSIRSRGVVNIILPGETETSFGALLPRSRTELMRQLDRLYPPEGYGYDAQNARYKNVLQTGEMRQYSPPSLNS